MREVHPKFEGHHYCHHGEDADFGNDPDRRRLCWVEGIRVNDERYYIDDDSNPDYCYVDIFYFLGREI